ncbi:MAG: 30S ribosome-binding factor RbfA [Pirellulaceae bacterium]|jgi:ribosome-binding factor A|nr:30S ribosome-binding factor RbfA [Pirellulaceae bacterium]
MSSRRALKAAAAIREVVSWAILTEISDPRVANVTVTHVEVSADMQQATVNVSIMGDEGKQQLCLRGLQNAAGFLQQKIGQRIDTRYIPKLRFALDKGVKHSLEVDRILQDLNSDADVDSDRGDDESPDSPSPDGPSPNAV